MEEKERAYAEMTKRLEEAEAAMKKLIEKDKITQEGYNTK